MCQCTFKYNLNSKFSTDIRKQAIILMHACYISTCRNRQIEKIFKLNKTFSLVQQIFVCRKCISTIHLHGQPKKIKSIRFLVMELPLTMWLLSQVLLYCTVPIGLGLSLSKQICESVN